MAKKFSFLQEAGNEATKARNTDTMIDIDLIDPYELNDEIYPPEQYGEYMSELIEDIRRRGLKQPIELMVNPNDKSRYISIGGNRRCAAIRHLVNDEGLEQFRMVKATISEMTEEEARINCIMSNNHRDKTNYTIMKEIAILQEIAENKKARGEEIVSLRSWLANQARLGKTQTGKIQRVINKGVEELQEAIEKEIVSLEAASEIASLPDDEQLHMIELIKNGEMSNKEAYEVATDIKKKLKEEKNEKKTKKNDNKNKVKVVVVNKVWNKVRNELEKLLDVDDADKEAVMQCLKIIENRHDR